MSVDYQKHYRTNIHTQLGMPAENPGTPFRKPVLAKLIVIGRGWDVNHANIHRVQSNNDIKEIRQALADAYDLDYETGHEKGRPLNNDELASIQSELDAHDRQR